MECNARMRSRIREILIMLGTHVDDMLYGYTAAGEKIMNRILEKLEIGSQAEQSFRFVGRNFKQDPETFKIHVSSAENTKKIEPTELINQVLHGPGEPSQAEKKNLTINHAMYDTLVSWQRYSL